MGKIDVRKFSKEILEDNSFSREYKPVVCYECFEVWQNRHNGSYYYCEIENGEFASVEEVRLIAALEYDSTSDTLLADAEKLDSLFDNLCCGEGFTDETYYWFGEIESEKNVPEVKYSDLNFTAKDIANLLDLECSK